MSQVNYNDLSIVGRMVCHLSTDKVDQMIQNVLTAKVSPISFTSQITRKRSDQLYKYYAQDIQDKFPKLPKTLKDAWIYELVFRACVEYRLVNLFLNDDAKIEQMRLTALRAFILVIDQSVSASSFVGFNQFREHALSFFDGYPMRANASRIGLTHRLVSTIGNITDPDWIFHDPLWFDTFNNNRDLLSTFRGFLYVVVNNVFHTAEQLENMHDCTVGELLDHMESFIELRESSATTRRDIFKFIGSVEHYALSVPVSSFYQDLYGGPFSDLQRAFNTIKPDIDQAFPLFDNLEIVKYLSALGEDSSIDLILRNDIHPEYLVDIIYSNHRKQLIEEFLPKLYEETWFSLGYDLPTSKRRRNTILYDQLYLAIVGKRATKLLNPSATYVMNYLVNTSHILFNITDETETLGLSLIAMLLPSFISCNLDHINERELETLSLLQWAWSECNYDRPNRISKLWKTHFSNPVVRRGLRRIFFSTFEILQTVEEIDFNDKFGISRPDFFLYLENLCDYLTGNPMTQEVEEFFSEAPYPKSALYLNAYNSLMWIGTEEEIVEYETNP